MRRVYLDHNATTPIHPAAAEAVVRALVELPGNPSSVHREGQRARAAVEEARRAVGASLGASFTEVVFTSGATEANNLAVASLAAATSGALATTRVEHPSVLAPFERLARQGREVIFIDVDGAGRLPEAEVLAASLRARGVGAVSVMLANNETGNLYDVAGLARALEGSGVWVHTDATQALGRVAVDFGGLGVHLLSASGHKVGGPRGAGVLLAVHDLTLAPVQLGGHQERGRRGGTEDVAALVGLGVAFERLGERLASAEAIAGRRERLWEGIAAMGLGAVRQGDVARSVCNTLSVRFVEVDGETLLMNLDLDGISVSAGSACSAGSLEPSHVILAMGVSPHQARGSVRFSLGPATTDAEIDRVLDRLPSIVARSRG